MKASRMSHMQANGIIFHYVERARSGGVSHTLGAFEIPFEILPPAFPNRPSRAPRPREPLRLHPTSS